MYCEYLHNIYSKKRGVFVSDLTEQIISTSDGMQKVLALIARGEGLLA